MASSYTHLTQCITLTLFFIEQRINEHTQDSVKRRNPNLLQLTRKYNKLCADMEILITKRQAPKFAVAQTKIEIEHLFNLDVNDDIWLDIGLGYELDEQLNGTPPLWLSSDAVRGGIRALLERDRCEEEKIALCSERNSMQEWFSEEWAVAQAAVHNKGQIVSQTVLNIFCS